MDSAPWEDYASQDAGPWNDYQAAATPSAPQLSGFDQFLRQTALQGRAAAEGVVGAMTLPNTVATWAFNNLAQGANSLLGTHIKNYPSTAQQFSQALTSAGAPTPDTSMEQMGSSLTRGVTGALAGGGITGVSTVPDAIRVGAAGLAGGGAAEGARQVGLPPFAQFAAGAIGGFAPAAIEGTFNGAINAARPLFANGQQQIAGNVLRNQAANPSEAMTNLSNSQEIVPGSMPTSGAASQDTGILALEKAMRNRNPAPFGDRLSEQNAARQGLLTNMAGTEADLRASEATRSAEAAPLYASAAQDFAPVDSEMVALMQRPSMQAAITRAQRLAAENGRSFGSATTTEGLPMSLSGQDLQYLKMSLSDMANSGFQQGIGSHEIGAINGTLNDLKDWTMRNVPSARAADDAFRAASAPVNQMTVLQDLQNKSNLTTADMKTGQYFISPGGFSRGLDKIYADPFNPLTDNQLSKLEAIRSDLQNAQAVNSPLIRPSGSDTFQNLAMNQALGPLAGVGKLAKGYNPLNWIYNFAGADKGISDQLTNAMLDPKFAASLLRNAKPQIPLSQRISSGSVPYAIGTGFGLPGAVPYLTQ